MLIKRIFLFIIFLWIAVSVGRTFHSLFKLILEETEWIQMTTREKKIKLYGDIELIFEELEKVTTNEDCIFLYSKDNKSYFLLRYLLYPKKLFWASQSDEALMPRGKICKFAVFYDVDSSTNIEQNLKRFHSYEYLREIKSLRSNNRSILVKINNYGF